MAKKEASTDLWVASQLGECGIPYSPQGSTVKEIDDALKSASKKGTGNVGYPEFVAVVESFVLVIEDKANTSKHCKYTDSGILDMDTKAVTDYAVNGAYFYAKHIAQNSNFKKVFAIGVSGDVKHHKITPLYVDDRESYMELDSVESFAMFSKEHIQEYFTRQVLKENTPEEKTTEKILQDAAELHEYLRTYGALKDQDKPLVVSGILLALDEIKSGSFSINSLTGDTEKTDGEKIFEAIRTRLKRSNVGPDAKREKLMSEFAIIPNSTKLNTVDDTLEKTPLKYYAEFLKERVFDYIKGRSSSEDFIGRFYGEFMSYSGGDGQTLGIVLTPAHICRLFCDLLEVKPEDIVLEATAIFDRLNEALDGMPPYDRIFVRGHYLLPDLLNEYKELFFCPFVSDGYDYDEDHTRLARFEPEVGKREWPDPNLPESAKEFNKRLYAFFEDYLGLLAACREVKKVYAPFVTGILHRESAFPDSHALAKMFQDFEEREGHPFQKMKCRMSSFAYQPQKGEDGQMIFCEQIEFLDLRSFLYYDFWNGLRLNRLPTKCGLCGRFFLLEGGKYSRYCTNPLPDEPGKTCRDVGSKRRYDDRCRTDPVWQTYNRAYKAHYARYMKKKKTAARRPRRIRGVVKNGLRTPRPCGRGFDSV